MPATSVRRVHLGLVGLVAWLVAASSVAIAQTGPTGSPSPVTHAALDATRLSRIDAVVTDAISTHQIPGAVVVVGRGDVVAWRRAYGDRAVAPRREAMTVDTIFDLASLTKVLATAPTVMALVEDGRLRLSDTAATYIPEFAASGKGRITIRDLLTHTSGLRPDLDLTTEWQGHDEAIRRAAAEVPDAPPGLRFVYSDINYLVLAEIVARIDGRPFEDVVASRLLRPLQMRDTGFRPPASSASRIAPTEPATLRGIVHDPTARRMDGVAGHAGLFGTADDLVRFCRMMLHGGALDGARVLAPLTVARMTAPATPVGLSSVRGLGWDLDSAYSSNRGDLLPLGSYGHTGFTGTSLWIDPATNLYVIVLTNRVHPDGTGNATPLRARIASIAAAAVPDPPPAASLRWPRPSSAAPPSTNASTSASPTSTGIDVLRRAQFAPLAGLRVGLITNHTGRAGDGTATIDLLAAAPTLRLVALFSPEHGIRGILDAAVPSMFDDRTNLPIHSLYGATQRPTTQMLTGLDALVIDLQDVGTRFYTYMTTMAYAMEEAAARHIRVFVLDRPNPIGSAIEGPALDAGSVGFTGYLPEMPIRHGLTLGELARLFNAERRIGADLTVVPMTDWRREAWFDETGLGWINPSPNMRSLYAATLYPGLGAFERTNISVGRGTDTPFEHIGAPWIDGLQLATELNRRAIPGVRVYPESFTPSSSVYANQLCHGVFIVVTDRDAVRPVRLGVEVAAALWRLFPSRFEIDKAGALFGSADGVARLKSGEDPKTIADSWAAAETAWQRLSAPYRLYP